MRPVLALLRAVAVLVALVVHAVPVRADVVGGPLDRTTPRRAVASFLEAAQAGDEKRAAQLLDLKQITPAQRSDRGPELARMLHEVLERAVVLEPAQLSDDPAGKPEDGPNAERVTTLRLRGADVARSRSAGPARARTVSGARASRRTRRPSSDRPRSGSTS